MLRRRVNCEATHQEAPGATIVPRDELTYARQHAAFSRIDRTAQVSATRTEQLSTLWTGTPTMEPCALRAAACYLAVHNVDSSFSQDRPVQDAQAKRRTLNQNPQRPGEGLQRVETRLQTTTGSPVLNRPPKRDSFKP
jgi:hypothetical protein